MRLFTIANLPPQDQTITQSNMGRITQFVTPISRFVDDRR